MQQLDTGGRDPEATAAADSPTGSWPQEPAISTPSSSGYIRYSRIANNECANMLKPQDIVIIGKMLSKGDDNRAQSRIAAELQMSPSEVNSGMKRAVKSGLLRQEGSRYEPVKAAISEFLLHGLKYAFPAERGQPTRGLPTSYAAAPLNEHIAMGSDLPPVWPHPQGETRGYELKPLYRSVPAAAKADPMLYQFLAVADALRDGAVRDKKIAEQALKVLLRKR
jgi:DNA-binding Lrp family transcriptional regulator